MKLALFIKQAVKSAINLAVVVCLFGPQLMQCTPGLQEGQQEQLEVQSYCFSIIMYHFVYFSRSGDYFGRESQCVIPQLDFMSCRCTAISTLRGGITPSSRPISHSLLHTSPHSSMRSSGAPPKPSLVDAVRTQTGTGSEDAWRICLGFHLMPGIRWTSSRARASLSNLQQDSETSRPRSDQVELRHIRAPLLLSDGPNRSTHLRDLDSIQWNEMRS